ncbi:MAG: MinD/ParA family protein [Zoogloea sp.]|nr:MinD/ParA family protein [Zoogloea sp.]
MLDGCADQASGLRRIFRRKPPVVVALFATGRTPSSVAMDALASMCGRGRRVIVLDEADGEHSLALSNGLSECGDLLQALDGRVGLETLLRPLSDGLWLLPAHASAVALPWLDETRRQQFEACLNEVQRRADLIVIRAAESDQVPLSPLVRAAFRSLLVVEASGAGARAACSRMRELVRAGAGSLEVAVAGARDRSDASALFASLNDFAGRQAGGLPLAWRGEIERDQLGDVLMAPLGEHSPGVAADAFLRRVRNWASRPAAARQA